MIKLALLSEELHEAGIPLIGLCETLSDHSVAGPATFFPSEEGFVRIDWDSKPLLAWITQAAAIIAAHDPAQLSESEKMAAVVLDSGIAASAIPGWATWTEAEAAAWYDTNVTALIDAIPDVSNLTPTAFQNNAQLIVAQMQDIITAQAAVIRNLARMLIAMHNKTWPELEGSE